MWTNTLLIILLLICVITDLKERKIYNKVLFPGFLAAVTYHIFTDGWSGITDSLLGALVGLSILLIPYLMGGMGAGDVKLLAVIGAINGMGFVLMTALYMALAGGIIGIFILLFRKGVLNRLKELIYFISCRFQGLKVSFPFDKEALSTTYPYGVAIAAGAIFEVWNSSGGLF
jgi:prepilin peptidase CpaA